MSLNLPPEGLGLETCLRPGLFFYRHCLRSQPVGVSSQSAFPASVANRRTTSAPGMYRGRWYAPHMMNAASSRRWVCQRLGQAAVLVLSCLLLVSCHAAPDTETSAATQPKRTTTSTEEASPSGSASAASSSTTQVAAMSPPADASNDSTEVEPVPTEAVSSEPAPIELFPGVMIVTGERPRVELAARVCLEEGWLEQIACMAGTREHESLVVPRATPSQVHAALLAIGQENGRPGQWTMDGETLQLQPPTGAAIDVRVRWLDGTREREASIWSWVHEPGRETPADRPFIFGGSKIVETAGGEIYLADHSGSIIGLVTFGDEVIGCAVVFSEQQSVQEPAWQVAQGVVPPYGTDVTLILQPRPAQAAATATEGS